LKRKGKRRGRSAILGTVELAPDSTHAHDILDLSAGAICLVDHDPNARSLFVSILDASERRAALEASVDRQRALED